MQIPVIIESNYSKSLWSNEILSGLDKNKLLYLNLSDIENVQNNSTILIIGSTRHFIADCVNLCAKQHLKAIVIGSETDNTAGNISSIGINRRNAAADMLSYFHNQGIKKTALLGISSYSNIDLEKRSGFVDFGGPSNPEDDIYYCDIGIENCINSLIENIHKYDAVICSNDYFAISFIIAAQKCQIRVPDDIMVSGFGDSYIGRKFSPSITSISPNYTEMGRQAAKLCAYLADNPEIASCNVNVNYDIIIRNSTNNLPLQTNSHMRKNTFTPCEHSTLSDKTFSQIIGLDTLMASSDRSITNILYGISCGISYSTLAERLYLSDTAFRYKLNKIFATTGIDKKTDLQKFLNSIFISNNDWNK